MWHFYFIFEIRNSIIQVKAKTETSLFYLIFIFSDFFSSKIGEFVDTFLILIFRASPWHTHEVSFLVPRWRRAIRF